MFAPLKTWRRWHRKVNVTQKRHALASAIAASGVAPLVMARGHKIDSVPQIPLVVSEGAEGISKTKDAVKMLTELGCEDELEKSRDSKKVRCGKGKMRNRRYVMKKGPLVVYAQDNGISKSFRNIPGVELCCVERLNLLQLAPGGNFGRFIIWTEAAFKKLTTIYGTSKAASLVKKNYHMPRAMMTNADLARIINSEEVQSVCQAAKSAPAQRPKQNKNPLKNISVLGRMIPGSVAAKKARARQSVEGTKEHKLVQSKKKANKVKKTMIKKRGKAFFKNMMAQYETKAAEKSEDKA